MLTTVSSNSMGSKILIPACTALNLFYKVLTVEHTSPDHSTQVFIIRHNGIHQIKQGWIRTSLWQLHACEAKGFLKTTNLPEVILVTIALSLSSALEKPWKFKKNETQKIYSGGFCPGGFCFGDFCAGGFCRGLYVTGGFCPRFAIEEAVGRDQAEWKALFKRE